MVDDYGSINYWNSGSGHDNFFDGWEEAKTPVQVPAGKYIAVLTSWTQFYNSKGTPNLKFAYRIERGEFAGQIVTDLKAMTKAAQGWTKQFCNSIGIDPRKDVSNYPEIWVELQTSVQDGADGRQYTNVQTVRRIVPPEGQTGSGQQSELPPGAF